MSAMRCSADSDLGHVLDLADFGDDKYFDIEFVAAVMEMGPEAAARAAQVTSIASPEIRLPDVR